MVRLSLTLYQFLGYLIPGSVVSATLVYLATRHFDVSVETLNDANLMVVVVSLFAAYVIGFLLQSTLSGPLEMWLFWYPKSRGMPSKFLVSDDDTTHSQAFKNKIALNRRICSRWSAGELSEQEYFDLLYSRAVADGRGQLIETFNALYALGRGLTAAFLIAATAVTASAIASCSDRAEWQGIILQGLCVAGLAASAVLCQRRTKSYGIRFADEVYRVGLSYEM